MEKEMKEILDRSPEERIEVLVNALRSARLWSPQGQDEITKLEKDEKPAVEIEIFYEKRKCRNRDKAIRQVAILKKRFEELGYFAVYNHKDALCVSKIRSVAETLAQLFADSAWKNAGAIGLLLGYNFEDVLEYLIRTREDDFLNIGIPRPFRPRKLSPSPIEVEEEFGKRYRDLFSQKHTENRDEHARADL
jgi:hypothetical protein